ncbi:hypothetical protein HMI54_006455 [Coelomomyces lativittatus]|nr:hypothetical protein HMI54_006455 [Coelomomyces lativittatus]KAJ1515563.1 hypothetical protein HMI56_003612 [Coelomomyces lativittatus]
MAPTKKKAKIAKREKKISPESLNMVKTVQRASIKKKKKKIHSSTDHGKRSPVYENGSDDTHTSRRRIRRKNRGFRLKDREDKLRGSSEADTDHTNNTMLESAILLLDKSEEVTKEQSKTDQERMNIAGGSLVSDYSLQNEPFYDPGFTQSHLYESSTSSSYSLRPRAYLYQMDPGDFSDSSTLSSIPSCYDSPLDGISIFFQNEKSHENASLNDSSCDTSVVSKASQPMSNDDESFPHSECGKDLYTMNTVIDHQNSYRISNSNVNSSSWNYVPSLSDQATLQTKILDTNEPSNDEHEQKEEEEEKQNEEEDKKNFYNEKRKKVDDLLKFQYDERLINFLKSSNEKLDEVSTLMSFSSKNLKEDSMPNFPSKIKSFSKALAKIDSLSLQVEDRDSTISELYKSIEALEATNSNLMQQISGIELDRAQNAEHVGLYSLESNPKKLSTLLQDFDFALDKFSRQLLVHPENKTKLRNSIQHAVMNRLMPVKFRQHHTARFVCGFIYQTIVQFALLHHPLRHFLEVTSGILGNLFVSLPTNSSYTREFYLHCTDASVRHPGTWTLFVNSMMENLVSSLLTIHVYLSEDHRKKLTSLLDEFLNMFYFVQAMECKFEFPLLGNSVSELTMTCDEILEPEDMDLDTELNSTLENIVLFSATPCVKRGDGVEIFHKACVFAVQRPSQLDRFADVAVTMDPLPICDPPPSEDDDVIMA